MAILVDTSIWINHFRQHDETLESLLQSDLALTHPMIIAEIACGTPPKPRLQTLSYLGLLQQVNIATMPEILTFVEREKLYGLGCGAIDIMLLASTLITPGATLWSADKRLAKLADRFKVGHQLQMH
ncbi:MAG: PIN domain nuclease [Gammaproteobacteria bacterium]|nr:PIN domain nuclease [Gammaproteobacteria bacterium]